MDHANQTLGDLARDLPAATTVFLRHQLDFCCGGHRTLSEACAKAGLDPAAISRELDALPPAAPGDGWANRPLDELIDHIEARYHATLRRDVPGLIAAAAKVERVHAAKPTVPTGLHAALAATWDELLDHMAKEEQVLFPLLRGRLRGPDPAMPIGVMRREHDEHAHNLRRLRGLAHDYVAPPEACATWRALYDGLAHLEAELMEHIHLENHVLFPRATGGGRAPD